MIPRRAEEGPRNFPLGNMAVGIVTEVGPEVTRLGLGIGYSGTFRSARRTPSMRKLWIPCATVSKRRR